MPLLCLLGQFSLLGCLSSLHTEHFPHTTIPKHFLSRQSEAMGQEESHSGEMDLAQIQELCIIFMKECPSGALHLHEFKRIFGISSSSAEESLYIETIFRSFDTNRVSEAALSRLDRIRVMFMYIPCMMTVVSCRITDWISWSM